MRNDRQGGGGKAAPPKGGGGESSTTQEKGGEDSSTREGRETKYSGGAPSASWTLAKNIVLFFLKKFRAPVSWTSLEVNIN